MNNQSNEEIQFFEIFSYSEHEMIYCPMCEDTHECNTNCQRND